MKKSEMASQRDVLLPRIVAGADVMESRAILFDQSSRDGVFDILVERERLHGLVGKASNRALKKESVFFRASAQRYRTPTGRTPEKTGRHYGAAYHLDAQ